MRIVVFLLLATLTTAGLAGADVGTISIAATATVEPGTYDVDIDLTMTTSGAASLATNDFFMAFAQIYYPYPWQTVAPSFTSSASTNWPMQRTDTGSGWQYSKGYSFTAPVEIPGTWGWYVFGAGWNTASGATSGGYIVWDSSVSDFAATTLPAPLPPIFGDDFESGDTGAWSATVPLLLIGAGILLVPRRKAS